MILTGTQPVGGGVVGGGVVGGGGFDGGVVGGGVPVPQHGIVSVNVVPFARVAISCCPVIDRDTIASDAPSQSTILQVPFLYRTRNRPSAMHSTSATVLDCAGMQ